MSGGVRFGYDDTEKEAKYTEIDVSAGLGLPGVSGDVAVTITKEMGKKYELKELWEAGKSSLE